VGQICTQIPCREGLEHLIALDVWDKCKRKMLKSATIALWKAWKEETCTRLRQFKKAWLWRMAICKETTRKWGEPQTMPLWQITSISSTRNYIQRGNMPRDPGQTPGES
jgi:hypothetical protein